MCSWPQAAVLELRAQVLELRSEVLGLNAQIQRMKTEADVMEARHNALVLYNLSLRPLASQGWSGLGVSRGAAEWRRPTVGREAPCHALPLGCGGGG